MAAGGNNQRLTSPSCNPLRLAKHAANDRSNFHYCKTFIYELCRCQSTQILKTVKSQKSSFDKMFKIVFLDLKCLNIFVATYLLRPPSKHRQRCLAPAERKVVPPRVRGPLPPLPLCNFGSRSIRTLSRVVLLSGTAEPGTCPPPLLHHVCLYSSSVSLSQFQSTESTLLNMSDEEETDYSQTEGEEEDDEGGVHRDRWNVKEDQNQDEHEQEDDGRPYSRSRTPRCSSRCKYYPRDRPIRSPRSSSPIVGPYRASESHLLESDYDSDAESDYD